MHPAAPRRHAQPLGPVACIEETERAHEVSVSHTGADTEHGLNCSALCAMAMLIRVGRRTIGEWLKVCTADVVALQEASEDGLQCCLIRLARHAQQQHLQMPSATVAWLSSCLHNGLRLSHRAGASTELLDYYC